MMQITEGLRDKVWKQIEQQADPAAMALLRDALAALPYQEQAVIENAAIALAGSWADSALWVGFQMAANPGAWLFAEQS